MTKTKKHAEDTCPLVYQCRLPLSTRTVSHLADLLRRHLKVIRSRWRTLPPGKIAVIVLAVLRYDQRLADMAGGNNVPESTVRRWRDEELSARSCDCRVTRGGCSSCRVGTVVTAAFRSSVQPGWFNPFGMASLTASR